LSRQQEFSEWEFLIGYPLEQAQEILLEEGVAFEVIWTAAPKYQGHVPSRDEDSAEDTRVVAVRRGSPVGLVCAVQDWNVD